MDASAQLDVLQPRTGAARSGSTRGGLQNCSVGRFWQAKRSVISLEVLRCAVKGKPSFFHAASLPSRTQTFEMPIFCKATATRALVSSPEEEQYKTILTFSGTTTRIRLRRRAGSIRTAPGIQNSARRCKLLLQLFMNGQVNTLPPCGTPRCPSMLRKSPQIERKPGAAPYFAGTSNEIVMQSIASMTSQFCWLRPLPDLLHIPKRRGSNETAVFTGEL
jgi:hypothetical protein